MLEEETTPEVTPDNPRAFLDSLGDDYKEDKTLNTFKSDADFVKTFKEQESFMGTSIRIPSEEAGDEDRAKFYEKLTNATKGKLIPSPDLDDKEGVNTILHTLGKPSEIDGYEVPEVEGIKLSPERVEFMKQVALDSDITKKGFKNLMETVLKAEVSDMAEAQALRDQGKAEVQKEWGQAFDGKMERIYTVLNTTGAPTEVVDAIKANKMGPQSLKWLDGIADSLTGKNMELSSQPPASKISMTPAEATEQHAELLKTMRTMKTSDPSYKIKNQRLVELIAIAQG